VEDIERPGRRRSPCRRRRGEVHAAQIHRHGPSELMQSAHRCSPHSPAIAFSGSSGLRTPVEVTWCTNPISRRAARARRKSSPAQIRTRRPAQRNHSNAGARAVSSAAAARRIRRRRTSRWLAHPICAAKTACQNRAGEHLNVARAGHSQRRGGARELGEETSGCCATPRARERRVDSGR